MGRELRRVPLDFDWPLKKQWWGFLNPHYTACVNCAACDGSGYSPAAKRLADQWYGHEGEPFRPEMTGSTPFLPTHPIVRARAERNATGEWAVQREAQRLADHFNAGWVHHLDADDVAALVAADRLHDFTRRPRTDEQRQKYPRGWMDEDNGYVPTPREVNEWSIAGMGHDAINRMVCIEAKCLRLGIERLCAVCAGEGSRWFSESERLLADAWKETPPPEGPGYQIWETVSEGSPISPVFDSVDACVTWLVGEGYSEAAARAFMKQGWVMSGLSVNGQFYKDIESAAIPPEA